MAFGATAIALASFSMASRTEASPPGYDLLDYVILAAGVAAIIG